MTSVHDPEDDRVFYKECMSLAAAGYEVYLVAKGESYEKNGVHVVGVGQQTGGRFSRMYGFAKRVYEKALELDADLYHFHDPELMPFGEKLKKRGKKVIFDSHERYTEQLRSKAYIPSVIREPFARVYGWYEDRILRKMDAVIFPCTMSGKNPFEGKCTRAAIISNAAVLSEFFYQFQENAQKKDRLVCYVGGLSESRGITQNILAASAAGAVLALAGDFSSDAYKDQLQQMPEYSCVEYRGRLNRQGVTALLSESHVGLCTLLDCGQYLKIDTFSVKVFEYLSMAVPVILSKSQYNCQMVEKYQFGICVDPENTEEIAAAISYLLDHPDEANQMGKNGRRMIKEAFNWGVEEKKLLALYEDILKN